MQDNNTKIIDGAYQRQASKNPGLIIVDDQGFRQIDLKQFRKKELCFGRKTEMNDIVIASDIVSSSHGKIIIENDGISICDTGSSNGTFVAMGGHYHKLAPGQPFFSDMEDVIIRIGGHDKSVLLLYTQNAGGQWKEERLKAYMSIGREDGNDICLRHVSVSAKHAAIKVVNGQFVLEDCGSTNGLMVNGQRMARQCLLNDKDIIQITNSTIIFTHSALIYKTLDSGTQLSLQKLTKVAGRGKERKIILNQADCQIGKNEFVAIIGGSGAGKSTLMNAMSGFDKDITGKVYFNGLDLHQNFDSLKNIIGFVPQQDIIYENLTLYKMLYYTAKMKMPEDTTAGEIRQRIDQVLEMVELSDHQRTMIKRLSGGQKKRASIAVELLADPSLFFLDEPTSGLDPGTEQKLMYTLRRLSKNEGKTVIMVTHTTQNLHLCDKVIIMGTGGRICYYGSPEDARAYFEVDDLVSIYNLVSDQTSKWADKYNSVKKDVYEAPEKAPAMHIRGKSGHLLRRQFWVLVSRYVELIKNDMQRLTLLFAQPLIIGLLLAVVAEEDAFTSYEGTKSILFALSCSGIWIGMFNTIQEICKERVILKREYMSNLNLGIYMASKYLVQGIICAVQALILIIIFINMVGRADQGAFGHSAGVEMFISLFLTVYASSSLGFIVSALSKNGDRAMATAPFLLIIQLLFSGVLFDLSGITKVVSALTISRWSMEGLGVTNDLNSLPLKLEEKFPGLERELNPMFDKSLWHLLETWGILVIFVILLGVISVLLLRNLSKEKG